MTKSKQQLKKEYNTQRVAVLFLRFEAIWRGAWTQSIDQVGVDIMMEEWGLGIESLPDASIGAALAYYRKNGGKFPPGIPEFVQLAEQQSGALTSDEILDLIIRRDLSNPLVERIFKSISTYDWTHDKAKDLLPRIKVFMDKERVTPLKGIEDATRAGTGDQLGRSGMRSAKDCFLS